MKSRVALIQMECTYDKQANLDKAIERIERACDQGAELVCLQELFNTTYFCFEMDARHFDLAEPIPGPATAKLSELARERGVSIVAPLFERDQSGVCYNSAAFIGLDGSIIDVYRKSHIPLISTATNKGLEKYYFAEGDTGFKTFTTPGGLTVGVLICYDRHFPEGLRTLTLMGAQLILLPSTTAQSESNDIWEMESRVASVQNACWIGAVNRVGNEDGVNRPFFGRTLVSNPFGEVVARADDSEEIILHEIDTSVCEEARATWGFLRDRRPDLYGRVGARGGAPRENPRTEQLDSGAKVSAEPRPQASA